MNNLSDLQQQFNDLPGPYLLRVSREYTPEMDVLRCEAFPEANHSATNRDVYDGRAWHLTIHYTDELAANSRLIPGPDGFFKALTANPLLVDSWKATDWSRLVVVPSFRNLGLPGVMGLVALHSSTRFGPPVRARRGEPKPPANRTASPTGLPRGRHAHQRKCATKRFVLLAAVYLRPDEAYLFSGPTAS